MTETPFFFPNGSYNLFGVFHEPPAPASKSAFVFCHPWGEEKLWAHRVFVSFARALAADGHPVLRFDLMGNGDSDGEFSDSTLQTALSDVRCAVREVRRRTGQSTVSLMGLRLGASIAAMIADETPDVAHLILWAPIVDGGRYMQELLRINLTTQMASYKEIRQDRAALVAQMQQGQTVNIDGYELAHPQFAEVSGIKLAGSRTFAGPCFLAQVDRMPAARILPELEQLAAGYPRSTLVSVQEEPFWKEIPRYYGQATALFASTTEWLRAQ
ncbi:MAG: alpha/beta fold hydrolase [Vicinamibacteraceae bacterium]